MKVNAYERQFGLKPKILVAGKLLTQLIMTILIKNIWKSNSVQRMI